MSQDPEDAIEDTAVVHRATPHGLFRSIGLMAAHSWSVSSWRMIHSSPVWELESQVCGPPQRAFYAAPRVRFQAERA